MYDDDVAVADAALVFDVRTSVRELRARPSTHACELWMKRAQERITTSITGSNNADNAGNNATSNASNNADNNAYSNNAHSSNAGNNMSLASN